MLMLYRPLLVLFLLSWYEYMVCWGFSSNYDDTFIFLYVFLYGFIFIPGCHCITGERLSVPFSFKWELRTMSFSTYFSTPPGYFFSSLYLYPDSLLGCTFIPVSGWNLVSVYTLQWHISPTHSFPCLSHTSVTPTSLIILYDRMTLHLSPPIFHSEARIFLLCWTALVTLARWRNSRSKRLSHTCATPTSLTALYDRMIFHLSLPIFRVRLGFLLNRTSHVGALM